MSQYSKVTHLSTNKPSTTTSTTKFVIKILSNGQESTTTEQFARKKRLRDSEGVIWLMELPWLNFGPGDPNSTKLMTMRPLSTWTN